MISRRCSRPAALLALLASPLMTAAVAHEPPTPEQLEQARQQGDLEQRLDFVRQLENEKISTALQEKASLTFLRAALESQGLTPQQVDQQLFGGIAMAFPYIANTELPLSGPARTLTILVDFADMRASVLLPGLTREQFETNIYGSGTPEAQAFAPTESVNAYYKRASEGKVDIQGNVLGWYHFPKPRADYQPASALPAWQLPAARNVAIYKMMTEALTALDAAGHDFAQYDHDNDGDIDQITLIYAGPNTGWGSFWWAYKWYFFATGTTGQTAATFDGKQLNQFVFQFASRRGATNQDFDPTTLIHEMGHSFGLADYYDYKPGVGPNGGLGGFDMMDANRGNHNAFSRWLLDWIAPEVIGSTPPSPRSLVASGSPKTGTKAVAVFPALADGAAPASEMFIVENRARVGNDVGLPSEGLLIWHVNARPKAGGDGFEMDNSYTPRKLIRLVRADSPNDFATGAILAGDPFFRPPGAFTPTTLPGSTSIPGYPTGVSIAGLSTPAETMTASIGILPEEGPALAAAPPVAEQDAPALGEFVARIGRPAGAPLVAAAARESAPVAAAGPIAREAAPAVAAGSTAFDRLSQLDAMLKTAAPATIQDVLASQSVAAAAAADGPRMAPPQRVEGAPPADLVTQLMLTRLAGKDGPAAVSATMELTDPQLRRRVFTSVMEAWAQNNPGEASAWYFAPEQAALRSSVELVAGPRFARTIIRPAALNDLDDAVGLIAELAHPTEVWGALDALDTVADLLNVPADQLATKLAGVEKHARVIETFRQTQALRKVLDQSPDASPPLDALRGIIAEKLGEPTGLDLRGLSIPRSRTD